MRQPRLPQSPAVGPARGRPSRRLMLGLIAAAPLALAAAPAVGAADGLVLHRGWILRASDLDRLGRA